MLVFGLVIGHGNRRELRTKRVRIVRLHGKYFVHLSRKVVWGSETGSQYYLICWQVALTFSLLNLILFTCGDNGKEKIGIQRNVWDGDTESFLGYC